MPLGKGSKKNCEKAVRLTTWVDPPSPPPPKRSGCCDFFKMSLHILTCFTILKWEKLDQHFHICLRSEPRGLTQPPLYFTVSLTAFFTTPLRSSFTRAADSGFPPRSSTVPVSIQVLELRIRIYTKKKYRTNNPF